MSLVAMMGSDRYSLLWGPVVMALGPVMYWVFRKRRYNQSV
jgi:hypothetical protein